MGQITIIDYTAKPITFIGKTAGICYGSNTEKDNLNYKRGLKNIKDNHGRTFEYPDVTMILDGYSARVLREVYTHIIGTSRMQASTRYINYCNKFEYYIPVDLEDNVLYHETMKNIQKAYQELLNQGYKKEDVANLLPLGLNSKMVLKINLRAILHMAEVRMCSRAYVEYRELMNDMRKALSKLDEEWLELSKLMKPRCATCTEKESCEW